jgi:RHS repeat-associated protein
MVVDALGHVAWRRNADSESDKDPEHWYTYLSGSSRVMQINFSFPLDTMPAWSEFDADTTWRSYDVAGNAVVGREITWGGEENANYRRIDTRSYFGSDGKLRAQQAYNETTFNLVGERRGYFAEYRYDALGRRVLVRTRRDGVCRTSGSTADCTGGIERFVWSGDNILWELRGPGSDSATAQHLEQAVANGVEYGQVGYTHAGGVDRPLVVWKGTGGVNSAVVVPHLNWRGLFGRGTDASGNATTVEIEWPGFQTSAYHKYGQTQAETRNWMGSLLEGQRDAGGQMYMRNRYYDPATGQFTQPDPIGIAGGLNVYGFAEGDPVSYSDPYGLSACPCRIGQPTPRRSPESPRASQAGSGGLAHGAAFGAIGHTASETQVYVRGGAGVFTTTAAVDANGNWAVQSGGVASTSLVTAQVGISVPVAPVAADVTTFRLTSPVARVGPAALSATSVMDQNGNLNSVGLEFGVSVRMPGTEKVKVGVSARPPVTQNCFGPLCMQVLP